ncbi:hypothetical protein PSYMO_36061, partial [Pseudomonas amygdali pv. mori str. 301020]
MLVPLGFEQAVGETQGNKVLYRVLAQVVVAAVAIYLVAYRYYSLFIST